MIQKSSLSLLFFICLLAGAKAQSFNHNLYAVFFTDKEDNPYSVLRSWEYLSPAALERRAIGGVEIDERDLPLNPQYVQAVCAEGVDYWLASKWLNSLAIYVEDTTKLAAIRELTFVREIMPLGKKRRLEEVKWHKHFKQEEYNKTDHPLGYSLNQIAMLGGHLLHGLNIKGQGRKVAIFDGGFLNVYRMPAFDSLFANNQIWGTHDFVQGDEFVYEQSTHGTNVLSCMAANLPYLIQGTGPKANYYLFKTEDVGGEFRIEEFNWAAAAERADSLGIEIINSSLGYTSFNDKSMSYTYKDMDGKTALCSQAADVAVEKGILVINSAGNEGNGPWKYIGAPADAQNVLSIGAVRPNGKKAGFSSFGPTADGRIKPNVVAQGRSTKVAGLNGYSVSSTDGTSFSSPVLAGMAASLWSAFPEKNNWEIRHAIEWAGQQAEADTAIGFGIPNLFTAYLSLSETALLLTEEGILQLRERPLQASNSLRLAIGAPGSVFELRYYNSLGQLLAEQRLEIGEEQLIRFDLPAALPSDGIYHLEVDIADYRFYETLGCLQPQQP